MECRRLALLPAVLTAMALLAGCSLPDYTLDFNFTVTSLTSNPVSVNYVLTNSGSKKLYNVSVDVTVEARDATGAPTTRYFTIPAADMEVGSSRSGSVSVTLGGSPTYTNAYAWVSSSSWDTSGGATIF